MVRLLTCPLCGAAFVAQARVRYGKLADYCPRDRRIFQGRLKHYTQSTPIATYGITLAGGRRP